MVTSRLTTSLADEATPPAPCGVIDFALAYREAPLADIGFGLWRAGGPEQNAIGLSTERIRAFVTGYACTIRLDHLAAEPIAVYIRARGIQQAVNGYRAGASPNPERSARIDWIQANHVLLRQVIAEALEQAAQS